MSLRVLIVDDEPLARARLRTLLGDCKTPGALVEGEAGNATQAVEALRRQKFDLALIDIHMPGADGLTLAQTFVHQHMGVIECDSRPGCTDFRILIPLP